MATDTTIYNYFSSTQQNADRVHVMVDAHTVIGFGSPLKTDIGYNRIIPFFPLVQPDDIITFTIGTTTYKCVKGTTWERWCSSAFNTVEAYIHDGKYVMIGGRYLLLSGTSVSPTSEIIVGQYIPEVP